MLCFSSGSWFHECVQPVKIQPAARLGCAHFSVQSNKKIPRKGRKHPDTLVYSREDENGATVCDIVCPSKRYT